MIFQDQSFGFDQPISDAAVNTGTDTTAFDGTDPFAPPTRPMLAPQPFQQPDQPLPLADTPMQPAAPYTPYTPPAPPINATTPPPLATPDPMAFAPPIVSTPTPAPAAPAAPAAPPPSLSGFGGILAPTAPIETAPVQQPDAPSAPTPTQTPLPLAPPSPTPFETAPPVSAVSPPPVAPASPAYVPPMNTAPANDPAREAPQPVAPAVQQMLDSTAGARSTVEQLTAKMAQFGSDSLTPAEWAQWNAAQAQNTTAYNQLTAGGPSGAPPVLPPPGAQSAGGGATNTPPPPPSGPALDASAGQGINETNPRAPTPSPTPTLPGGSLSGGTLNPQPAIPSPTPAPLPSPPTPPTGPVETAPEQPTDANGLPVAPASAPSSPSGAAQRPGGGTYDPYGTTDAMFQHNADEFANDMKLGAEVSPGTNEMAWIKDHNPSLYSQILAQEKHDPSTGKLLSDSSSSPSAAPSTPPLTAPPPVQIPLDANGLPSQSASQTGNQGTGVSLSPTTPNSSLLNSTITPGPGTDRYAIAQKEYNDWVAQSDPQFQAEMRDANRYSAAAGRIGSGQATNSIGDIQTQRENSIRSARDSFLGNALNSSVDDAYKNVGIEQQQQQFQEGQQQTGFNQNMQLQTLANSEQGQQFSQLMTSMGFNAQQVQQAFQNAYATQQLSNSQDSQSFYQALQKEILGMQGDPAQILAWISGQYARGAAA